MEVQEKAIMNGLATLALCLIGVTTPLSILVFYSSFPNSFDFLRREIIIRNKQTFHIHPQNVGYDYAQQCDLFRGRWVRDPSGPLYTNASCSTIPTVKNCFLHGRNDWDFLYWTWKPHGCELPKFNPKVFFQIVRGKKLAFIGDSLARNQMESLLCLLTKEETPIDVFKDRKDRSRTWLFPKYNFTLLVLWTKFLVKAVEEVPREVFNLHLDQVDESWARNVSQGFIDYAIISASQWYFKKNYLYEGRKLLGCIRCDDQTNMTQYGVEFAIGKAIRTTLRYVNACVRCKRMVTIVRTISPSHFENGTWKTGGVCEKTQPYLEDQAGNLLQLGSKNEEEWRVRNNQMEEIARARQERRETRIHPVDITNLMLMRPDGHPGPYWRDKKKHGYNDCVHWCMPGPIDSWNDLLLALLRRIVNKSL